MFSLTCFSQQKDSSLPKKIVWSSTRLTSSDFRAVQSFHMLYSSTHNAATSYQINHHFQIVDDCIFMKITTVFICDSSWIRKTFVRDSYCLRHEQSHFDLAEVYARKLALAFLNFHFTENFKNEIIAVTDNVLNEANQEQLLYDDSENNHPQNIENQNKWCVKITEELKQLDIVEGKTIRLIIHRD